MRIRSWCRVIAELSAARRGTGGGQGGQDRLGGWDRIGAGCSYSALFQLELDEFDERGTGGPAGCIAMREFELVARYL
jgi:hypothetical protein